MDAVLCVFTAREATRGPEEHGAMVVVPCSCRYLASINILVLARRQLEGFLNRAVPCEAQALETVVMILRQMFNELERIYERQSCDGHICGLDL